MSTKDFRARQLRTNQIINSGSSLASPLLIYGLGSATNDSGGFKTADFVTGSNTWLYISGAVGSGLPGSTERGLVTFGGDLYISGNIYGGGIGGGGTPGGITTSVQFNDGSGNFGGDSDLTWQKTSNILTLTGSLLTTAFAQFAGGYGSSGVTIANNGDFSTNGNIVIDGTALITNNTTITGSLFTNGPAQFADGYGSSGVTIFNNGDIFTDGELRVEGITSLKGDSIFGNSSTDTIAINARITSSIVPTHNVTWNLGSPTLRWANIYTGDLHLQNDRGDWTIVEEKDFLCVVNNKSGKKFKMMLEPID